MTFCGKFQNPWSIVLVRVVIWKQQSPYTLVIKEKMSSFAQKPEALSTNSHKECDNFIEDSSDEILTSCDSSEFEEDFEFYSPLVYDMVIFVKKLNFVVFNLIEVESFHNFL